MGKLVKEYMLASRQRNKVEMTDRLKEAIAKIEENPKNGDLWMEKGLALAAQKLYREAADCYSKAISLDPFKGIYYRHRGHRFLSCFRFEDACADFTLASRLIPENWDVWYHLGLSYFLLGDYENAEIAYQKCYELSTEESLLVAIVDWYWVTLQRLGKKEKAAEILSCIREEFDPGENMMYFRRLLMYKGIIKPEDLMPTDGSASPLETITMGFGLSNYYELMGNRKKSDEVIDILLEAGEQDDMFFAFGCLAGMVDKENRSAGK